MVRFFLFSPQKENKCTVCFKFNEQSPAALEGLMNRKVLKPNPSLDVFQSTNYLRKVVADLFAQFNDNAVLLVVSTTKGSCVFKAKQVCKATRNIFIDIGEEDTGFGCILIFTYSFFFLSNVYPPTRT